MYIKATERISVNERQQRGNSISGDAEILAVMAVRVAAGVAVEGTVDVDIAVELDIAVEVTIAEGGAG